VYFHHKFDHVFEGSPEPKVSFVVCALPRTGSSLLCELLALTELAGAPSEVFEDYQMSMFKRAWRTDSFEDYVRALIEKKTSPNGVFGFKAHYQQLIPAFGDRDLTSTFPNLHFIYIKRLDHVRQAVSYARATQTEQWTSVHEPATAPVYDREQIGLLLEGIEVEEQAWERYIARYDAPLHRVVYEDFAAAVDETVIDVMHFLGIDLPPGFEVPRPTLHRQADALTDEWVARFLREGQLV